MNTSYRWAEISLLLRKPILQEEDMLYTVAAAEAGLMYTEEVKTCYGTVNLSVFRLSRLVPLDSVKMPIPILLSFHSV